MRYAWNLAHGSGLVWNPGERVEGYSNLLTTLLMAVACAVFDRRIAAFAVQWLGLATVLAAGFLTARVALRLVPRPESAAPSLRVVALAAALAFYPLWYWSLTGMETGLVTLLFAASLWAGERSRESDRGIYPVATGLLAGLLAVARPDGVLLSTIALLSFAYPDSGGRRRPPAAGVAVAAGIAAGILLLQIGFRVSAYGTLLPNTFTLKMGQFPWGARLEGGIGYLRPFVPALLALLAPLVAGAWRRPSRLKAVAIGSLVGLASYQIAVGGDPWPYWRLVTPAIPLGLSVAACEIWTWARRGPGRGVLGSGRRALAAALLAALVLILNGPFGKEADFSQRPYQWYANVPNVNAAIALRDLLAPSATVGCFWAGAIPYYTSFRAVDFLGKCDPRIAGRPPDLSGAVSWGGMKSVPGHNKYDLNESIVALSPTYVQGFRWGAQDLSAWGRAHYDSVVHRGVPLWLRRGAPERKP